MELIRKIKCWLGFHNWKNIDTIPHPALKKGQAKHWRELHQCKHCNKKQFLAMGIII